MLVRPKREFAKHGRQRQAKGRDRILHFGRDLGIDLAVDDAVRLQFSQLGRQHSLSQSGKEPPELVESLRTVENVENEDGFPLPSDYIQRGFYWTVPVDLMTLLAHGLALRGIQ